MGQNLPLCAQLGAARSRQDESKEAGELGSKRTSSGCNGVHHVWWGGLIFRLLSRLPRFGSCLEKRHVFLLWIAERKPSMRAALVSLVCLSCFVAWGFGFCRTGLWARPRPGALGGALVTTVVMPRKIWSGPVLPPPKFPGVAMESCLQAQALLRASMIQ
jgi:hypothetical protein